MIVNIALIIGIISVLIYILYIVIFSIGLNRPAKKLSYIKRTVSVVVAARNEERYIGKLLTGLINQSYPNDLYEIIIANDRSNDKTKHIVEQFQNQWNNIKLININNTPKPFSPKKYALTKAIESSSSEIILLTDADCMVNKFWIEAMVSQFKDNTDFVAGFSRTKISNWQKAKLVTKFEFLDFLVMFMAAAGAILSKKAFSCSNQNLAYKRKSFLEVGGFEKIKNITSGDDVNLMQLFRKAKMNISFSLIHHTFIYTKPVNSWLELINQRSRWASNSKWQLFLNLEFFIYLSAVFMLSLSIVTLLIVNWKLALLLFFIKLISEFVFISIHFKKFETDNQRISFVPIWSLSQPFYILAVAVLGVFELFVWKPQ